MKVNASKKQIRQTWDEVYANNSSIEFVCLILIPICNDQTLSTYFSALCPVLALDNVNTPSAHGLENSKASNQYQVDSVKEVYPSRRDK